MRVFDPRVVTLAKARPREGRHRGHVLATAKPQRQAPPNNPQGLVRIGLANPRHVPASSLIHVGKASDFIRERKIHPTTARRANSYRKGKVLTD